MVRLRCGLMIGPHTGCFRHEAEHCFEDYPTQGVFTESQQDIGGETMIKLMREKLIELTNILKDVGHGDESLAPVLTEAEDIVEKSYVEPDWKELALHLLDCEAATGYHLGSLKSGSKSEKDRHRSILRSAIGIIEGTGGFKYRNRGRGEVLKWAVDTVQYLDGVLDKGLE